MECMLGICNKKVCYSGRWSYENPGTWKKVGDSFDS